MHVAGAGLGGATAGVLVGGIGWATSLDRLRPPTLIAAIGIALVVALRAQNGFGRRRQVPRAWIRTMPPRRALFLWGALLGSGVATLIPHSALVLLVAAQLAAGAWLAALSGLVFGIAREAPAALALLEQLDPQQTMALLARLGVPAARVNVIAVTGGGAALVASAA